MAPEGLFVGGCYSTFESGPLEQKLYRKLASDKNISKIDELARLLESMTPDEQEDAQALISEFIPELPAKKGEKRFYWRHLSPATDAIRDAVANFELLNENGQAGLRSLYKVLQELPKKKRRAKPG